MSSSADANKNIHEHEGCNGHGNAHEHNHASPKHEKHEKHEHASHGHHHHDARKISRQRLLLVLGLSGTFMLLEAAAGYFTGSLALIADAGHMLGDVAALALAYFAIWLSSQPAGPTRTYGYHRSEILAALANSVLLVLISIFVLFESVHRMAQPPEIHSTQMLIVAVIGLCINLISMRLLSDGHGDSLNARAAYLEVVSDMLASIGVILAASIMMTTGWYLADPLISAVLSLFILIRTWGLLRESIDILMESAPGHVDLEELSKSILRVAGVIAVHDLHVWTITSGMVAMSGHVTVQKDTDSEQILDNLKHLLEHDFSITHTTIQLENEAATKRCNDICAIL